MAELSIIEFGVYGFITYSSLLMLIISTVKEIPTEKSGSIVRGIWLIPGLICAFVLASASVNIATEDSTVTNTILDVNSTNVWTETVQTSSHIELQDPVWVGVHILIFSVLLIYIILQIVTLFTKIT